MAQPEELRVLRGLFALLFVVYFAASLRDIHRFGIRRRFDRLPGIEPGRRVHDEAGLARLITTTRGGVALVALVFAAIVLFTDTAVWIPAVAFPVVVLVGWLVLVTGAREYMSDEDPGP